MAKTLTFDKYTASGERSVSARVEIGAEYLLFLRHEQEQLEFTEPDEIKRRMEEVDLLERMNRAEDWVVTGRSS